MESLSVKGISLMIILPLLFLLISLNIWNFHTNLEEIYGKSDLLKQKRWVEDCLSAIFLKVKNFFPIRIEGNKLFYSYREFEIGYVVNRTNRIIANYSGGCFFFDFSEDFKQIDYNLTSSYYSFTFKEPFSVFYVRRGKRRSPATYYFYYNGELRYSRRVDRGFFILLFLDGNILTVSHSYLRINNFYRKDFIMEFDKELDLKILLWAVKIKRGRFYYEGYIKWR